MIGLIRTDKFGQSVEIPVLKWRINMRFMRVGTTLLFLAPLSGVAGGSHAPTVLEDRVVFASGKELRIERHRIMHSDPLEALRAREPVAISQRVYLVGEWQRLILVETQKLYEDEIKVLTIFDYGGERRGEPRRFMGDALVLQKVGRILLAQRSAHHAVRESYILNSDGELMSTVAQPSNVLSFEVTPDQRLIGILSQNLIDGRPVIKVSVVQIETGRFVRELRSDAEGVVEFFYGGNQYTIRIPEPQPPG